METGRGIVSLRQPASALDELSNTAVPVGVIKHYAGYLHRRRRGMRGHGPISGTKLSIVGGALRVFLSHTSELRDLPRDRSFVAAAEAAIIRAGHAVSDMAYFAARDSTPADTCVAKVTEAQVYVGIIGQRYGAVICDGHDLSYTELEFDTATSAGLPRLVFMIRDGVLPVLQAGEPNELIGRQQAFRRRLLDEAGLTVVWVSSPGDLEVGLVHALMELDALPEAATSSARRTLPRDVASFTGRELELDLLLAAVFDGARTGRSTAISAIDGMAGVGKTAFAVHAAQRLALQFPDGQMFLDLHANTAGRRPATPAEALGSLLLTLGVSAQAIPADEDARAALWRDRLAGKRILILLDDAASSEQVEPLLPGAPGCLVLITSRRRLGALADVQSLTLDTLPLVQAIHLLSRLIGAGSDSADRTAMSHLVELCGCLPLAIRLLAGRLRSHPSWSVDSLVSTLSATQNRLAELHVENVTVAASFDVSYQNLSLDHRRLFRNLGLHPGQQFDAYAAAALDGIDVAKARQGLEALYNDHLIDEPLPGRYRMHDLIRAYADALATHDHVEGRDTVIGRLLDFYLQATVIANNAIARRSYPPLPTNQVIVEVPDMSEPTRALGWLEAERANLSACFDYAVRHSRRTHVISLASAMHSFLYVAGHWTQAVAVHKAALTVARHMRDRRSEAAALNDLGSVQYLIDQYDAANESLAEAVYLYRECGDVLGRANALNDLANVQRETGDLSAATASLTESLNLSYDLDDRLVRANALHILGAVQRLAGSYSAATAHQVESLILAHQLGNLRCQANVLREHGALMHVAGDYLAATRSLTEALTIDRQIGYRNGQAIALVSLGRVQSSTGDYPAATASLAEAHNLYIDLADQLGQVNALMELGKVQRLTGDYFAATASLTAALDLAVSIGYQRGRAYSLGELGVVQGVTGQISAATVSLNEALGLFRAIREPYGQMESLNNLGWLLLESFDHNLALMHHQEALHLAQDMSNPLQEARSHEGIGRCFLRAFDSSNGIEHLRQALKIYQRLSAPEAVQVRAALIDLCGSGA